MQGYRYSYTYQAVDPDFVYRAVDLDSVFRAVDVVFYSGQTVVLSIFVIVLSLVQSCSSLVYEGIQGRLGKIYTYSDGSKQMF